MSRPNGKAAVLAAFALVAYLAALLWSTHCAPKHLPFRTDADGVAHFVAYFGLTLHFAALADAVRRFRGLRAMHLRLWLRLLLLVSAIAMLDELTQPLTGRRFQWSDWLSDTLGAALALMLYAWVRRRLKHRAQGASLRRRG